MPSYPFRFGPIALTTTYTTNLLNPPTTTGGVNVTAVNTYILLRHIRILNKTADPHTYRLWIGATGANAAGTEFMGYDKTVAANSVDDWYAGPPGVRLDPADFLVGGTNAATSLTIFGEGEIVITK